MLVSEGKTALKRFGFDDNDPLLLWLNAGLHAFQDAHEWPFLTEAEAIVMAVPTGILQPLPPNYRKIISLRDMNTGLKLQYIPISQFERETSELDETNGSPYLYTILAQEIVYRPGNTSSTEFRLIYQAQLPEMTSDGAQMPGPTQIHFPIVQAAAYIGLQAENEEDRAVSAQAQFASAVERLWNTYSTEEADEPGQVTDVMGYGC